MTGTARFQVLLASLCFGTTGTVQALGPDGLAPAGVGAGREFCSSAADCSSPSRSWPAVFSRLPGCRAGLSWSPPARSRATS